LTTPLCSYQHIFSGAKRRQPDEAKGGIIADEMGLGKTLVILSTIAGSLDRSEQFFTSESKGDFDQAPKMTASRATLVLAPSSRKFCSCQIAAQENFFHSIHQIYSID
jgi:SWI/SNF-related matrix-associated actin-dependent regulator of chromatin subfamily A3